MIQCPQCGAQNQTGARFCSGCGVQFVFQPSPTKKKTNHTGAIIAVALLGMCAMCGIIGKIGDKANTNSVSSNAVALQSTPAPTNYVTPPPVVKVTPIIRGAMPAPAPLSSSENASPPSTRKKRKKQDAVNANDNSLGTNAPASVSSGFESGYHVGPRGGCYTYSASGKKRYVDHSYCR